LLANLDNARRFASYSRCRRLHALERGEEPEAEQRENAPWQVVFDGQQRAPPGERQKRFPPEATRRWIGETGEALRAHQTELGKTIRDEPSIAPKEPGGNGLIGGERIALALCRGPGIAGQLQTLIV
jgi:hypothetical protein